MIANEVSMRHVRKFLAVLASEFERRGHFVRDKVVHKARAGSSRVSQPHYLYRSRTQSENLISSAFCVSVHVDQNVNAILVNSVRCLAVAGDLREVDEMFGFLSDF